MSPCRVLEINHLNDRIGVEFSSLLKRSKIAFTSLFRPEVEYWYVSRGMLPSWAFTQFILGGAEFLCDVDPDLAQRQMYTLFARDAWENCESLNDIGPKVRDMRYRDDPFWFRDYNVFMVRGLGKLSNAISAAAATAMPVESERTTLKGLKHII